MKHLGKALLAAVFLCVGHVAADDGTTQLIRSYCVDCHGAPDEDPEGDFSLTADFSTTSARDVGPTLKRTLDAIEGFDMPPSDAEQPSTQERQQLIEGIRGWLSRPTLGTSNDPGRPVIRRLTRLEYNNTVRDLLGLETDVFQFSERLPFSRGHYQPRSGKMPGRVSMSAREYGAKYPVLLPDASLPGDSRAEYGFANRGDAQNLSAVRLEQYLRLAGQIAFHPELLSRGERMEELFPRARFRQLTGPARQKPKPLADSAVKLATNNNVSRTADGSHDSLEVFRKRLEAAYAEDRGGVFSGEPLRNTTIAGKGGLLQVAYGKTSQRVFAINPNEDWWFASFATAIESSGDTLLANYKKKLRKYELTFQPAGGGPFAGIAEIACVVLSRRGEQGTVRLKATFDDDATRTVAITLQAGAGTDNTFASLAAEDGRRIKRLEIDGSDFSGDYVLLDDLAFITRDAPNEQPLVQVEEPVVAEVEEEQRIRLQLDRDLAKASLHDRVGHFLKRAFRREVASEEVDAYLALYRAELQRGGNDEAAMRSVIQGVLASPGFLYLSNETSEDPDEGVARLSGEALASRLSYLLWSTMPDDELMALGASGRLHEDAVLESQVRRLLQDSRSIELTENFFVAWLRLQELWSAQPEQRKFRDFYSGAKGKRTLAQDMFAEVLLLMQTILVENRPVTDLLDADYTYINAKLARLYDRDADELRAADDGAPLAGIDLDDDRVWHRVRRIDAHRGGIVTSPAVLTLTSFPHRTSSIRRGVWLLDTLFNRHPPAPKVAVADIDEQPNAESLTLRERVELHRSNPACAVCHDRIDPPGFALENFDAIGRWRVADGDDPIDASGDLAGLGSFRNPAEFKSRLLSDQRRFVQGLVEHLLSYALGRRLEYFDTPAVEQIVDRTMASDSRISAMIVEIAKSYPFRHARVTD